MTLNVWEVRLAKGGGIDLVFDRLKVSPAFTEMRRIMKDLVPDDYLRSS